MDKNIITKIIKFVNKVSNPSEIKHLYNYGKSKYSDYKNGDKDVKLLETSESEYSLLDTRNNAILKYSKEGDINNITFKNELMIDFNLKSVSISSEGLSRFATFDDFFKVIKIVIDDVEVKF